MVRLIELYSRVQEFYTFDKDELVGIGVAILISAFVFTFRDWGSEQFNIGIGLVNLLILIGIAAISFFFRVTCQKIYGLSQGQSVRFKVWWPGLFIMILLAFISAGRIPVLFLGASSSAFMVKQRLGEYRYGFSYLLHGIAAFWGVLGNLILALLFSLAAYFWSYNYVLSKAINFNLIFALCALLPLPQLEGLSIYFGNRYVYIISIVTTLAVSLLLLSRTKIGLLMTLILGIVAAVFFLLISSDL